MFDRVGMLIFVFYYIHNDYEILVCENNAFHLKHTSYFSCVIFFWLGLYILTMQVAIKWLIKTKSWVMVFLRLCKWSPPYFPLTYRYGSVTSTLMSFGKTVELSRLESNWCLQSFDSRFDDLMVCFAFSKLLAKELSA